MAVFRQAEYRLPSWKTPWLHNTRLGRKQSLGDWWRLKLYNGITQKKNFSQILLQNLGGSYKEGIRWQQLPMLAKRKSIFTLWMWKSRTHWLSEHCFAGIQKACIYGFNLAYSKIHVKQYFHVKIECLDTDSSSLCVALGTHLCLYNYETVTRWSSAVSF